MKLLGNIIWLIFGGLELALLWCIVGILCAISIIGIPWARSCFVIARLAVWPFGKSTIRRDELTLSEDIGTSELGTIGNILWLIVAGWWLALGHLIIGLLLCLTIIFIPFGLQHFKLAKLALFPIGVTVTDTDVADLAQNLSARDKLDILRSRV